MKLLYFTLLLTLTLPALAAVPSHQTLIAHRGESHDAPENTLPAFKYAVERGFGFECDLYLSKDHRVFTFHDSTLHRTTGGKDKRGCGAVTWSNDLVNANVANWGKWKQSKFNPTPPALFEDVLALARDGRYIYAEIKTGPHIVPYIKKIVESQTNATPQNLLFISFNGRTCIEVKKQLPDYKVYMLVGASSLKPFTSTNIINLLKRHRVDGIDCSFDPKRMTPEIIKEVQDAGFSFHVWTINSFPNAMAAFKLGVDSVTTDRAQYLLDCYRKSLEEGEKAAETK